ncbi:nucleoporin p54-like [Lineus longissimus]|uniref:nucleoporin p54-like n=1 Tax=Lineus longissimus TaxID=88925 RepID=UPI002B4CD245
MAFSFGQTSTATPAFSFGATTNTTVATTSAAPAFGFGAAVASTATPAASTGFNFSGFGAKTTASTLGFGSTGFGTTTTAATNPFGFGASTAKGFGTTGTATTGFGFGSTAGTSTGTGFSFGTATTNPATGFGFGTGSTLGATTGFGTTTGLAGATGLGQTQQPTVDSNLANMVTAVSMPTVYGDERDSLLAKWNQLQAFWGTGKGYFSQTGAVVFCPENSFCRFKAVGYSCLPASRNEDGLVGIFFKKKYSEVSSNQQQIVDSLHKILGSKPTLSVCVDGLKPLPDDKAELIIYVLERHPIGTTRRIPATELNSFLIQSNIASQLQSQLAVETVIPKMGFSEEQLKQYLDTPPAGIDPLLWDQAKLDNPNPTKLIPVPMIGFSELHKRLQHQEQQTKLHQNRLDIISSDIAELQRKHSNTIARTEQYKRKYLELGHRVLKVMVRQETQRKLGYAIQADEEQLRVGLETIQAELNAPTQFKGRLNELMSQIRMQNQTLSARADIPCQMDPAFQQEVKQHLKQQQEGLQHLINIIKEDLGDLQLVEQGLADTTLYRR